MTEFVRAMAASELPPGQCRELVVGGLAIAIYNVGGTFHATSNLCLHRGGPLGQGMLDGQVVMCPWHAWSWDVTTGENTANGTLKMACYEVRVEDGEVYVKVI
jgi:nitrite reductase (NADH) small subunit/3-phenylpropionate/trans-cinnamate dioxygenase ferredoxin subunit